MGIVERWRGKPLFVTVNYVLSYVVMKNAVCDDERDRKLLGMSKESELIIMLRYVLCVIGLYDNHILYSPLFYCMSSHSIDLVFAIAAAIMILFVGIQYINQNQNQGVKSSMDNLQVGTIEKDYVEAMTVSGHYTVVETDEIATFIGTVTMIKDSKTTIVPVSTLLQSTVSNISIIMGNATITIR